MRRLQLYIGTERVDLFKDETVSLTQTIQNVKDIAKVFTEFTQTFSVPASSVNNKIFEHYYNFDIIDGFDARNKVAARIELNDLPFKTGLIALQGVDLKNNLAHTYKITFYGNTVNLKDILGADQLASLAELNQYSLEYNYANVKGKLEGGAANEPLITPLLTHSNRLIYDSGTDNIGANNLYYNSSSDYDENGVLFTELKFAITLKSIIDAIQAKYTIANDYQSSIIFSSDFFNNATNVDFNYLYMWLHRKKGNVETTTAQGGFSWSPVPLTINTETGERILFVSNGSITIGSDFIGGLGETKLSITPVGSNPYSVRVLQDGAIRRLVQGASRHRIAVDHPSVRYCRWVRSISVCSRCACMHPLTDLTEFAGSQLRPRTRRPGTMRRRMSTRCSLTHSSTVFRRLAAGGWGSTVSPCSLPMFVIIIVIFK